MGLPLASVPMAIVYQAELKPTKLDLLAEWLPKQSWHDGGDPANLERVGAFRFDDPAGEVGVETHLVRADDGAVLQIPLTYRAAPLPDAEPWLVGTMDHSVLGKRWAYDASADPVYANCLASVILTGGTQVDEFVQVDDRLEQRRTSAGAVGSGTPGTAVPTIDVVHQAIVGTVSTIATNALTLTVIHVLDGVVDVGDAPTLSGTWEQQDTPVVLAFVS